MAISVGSVSVDVVPDARRFVPDLRAKLGNIPKVSLSVDADTRGAEAAIARAGRGASATVNVDADTGAAAARIASLGRGSSATVNVDADTAAAKAKIDAAARDRKSNVNVRVDDQGSILSTTNRLGALLTAGVALGPTIVPVAAAAAAAVGAIGIGALAGVAGIGTLVLGFSGVSDAVKALSEAQTTAGRDAAKNAAAQVAAAEQVKSAEAALVNTRANAADAGVRSAQAVADAQRGVRDATREAAKSVQDALSAQTTAQRGVEDATRAAAASVRDALAQQATAQRGVEDAARAAAASVRDALQRQVDAQRAVVDATRAAARSVADALFAQQQAEQSLARAQVDARQAQLSLTQAREDARRSLEDLTLQMQDGALAQRRAVLSVQDAQDSLNKTLADPKATDRQRQQAQLSYDEAVQGLDEIAVRNQRLAKEKADADKAGINGSKQVQAATAGIATAEQRVQDARTNAKRAADATTQARVAGEESVAKARQQAAQADTAVTEARRAGDERELVAQQQLARASQGVAEARRAGDERVLVARQALAKAEQGVADARVAGERRVADAQAAVSQAVAAQVSQQRQSAAAIAQAQAAVASAHRAAAQAAQAQSTSLQKVDDAMKALSPAGKAFALFLFSLKGRFDALKATAQQGLLPGVQSGIQALLPLLPILNRIVGNAAQAMGELFAQAGKALTSPFWVDFFNMIANTVGPNLRVFGGIILNLATGFAGLLMAFQPLNAQLGAGLLALSQRFADFGANASKSGGFQAFMAYVQSVGPLIISTIRSLATTIGRIVIALAPIGPIVLQSIGFLADVINRIPIDVLTVLAVTIGGLILGFQAFAAVMFVVDAALNANPIGLVVIGLVALGAAFVVAYQHSETFRNIVNAAWAGIQAAAAATWAFLQGVFSTLGGWLDGIKNAFTAFGGVVSSVWGGVKSAASTAWGFIAGVFNAIVGYLAGPFKIGFAILSQIFTTTFQIVRAVVVVAWAVIGKIFSAIVNWVGNVITTAFRNFKTNITLIWNAVAGAIRYAWDHWFHPVFKAIWDWVGPILKTAFDNAKTNLTRIWNGIAGAVLYAWNTWFHPVFKAIWDWVGPTLKTAFDNAKTNLTRIWNGIAGIFKTAYDKVIKPAFDILSTAITDTIPKAFGKGVGAIKTAWDKIKDYAKAPVRFVIETVLNHGILAAFNSIAEKVLDTAGAKKIHINSIPLPKGFARGTEDHRAQIAHPRQPRLWAEPETGGEAYIPLAPSKRPRSARILRDVAERFGYGLVRMANGGTLITAGRHLRDLGYDVSEGPDGFGPIHHVHAAHSRHYDGMAIDINHGAGTSKTEQAALSRIVPYLQGLGLRIIFMAPGHYNHLHAEVPRSKGLASQIGHLIGGAAGAVKGAAGAVADFLDPSQLIMGPLSGLLAKIPGAGSTFGKIVAGAPRSIATMLVNKAKEFVGLGSGDTKDFPAGGGGEFGAGGGVARWRPLVARVVAELHQPSSAVDAVLRRIQFESGGNPTAINRTDINAQMGHPSQGLMQVIPGTFVAYAGPYRSRGLTDPLANIYAGANYAMHRYHSLAAIDPRNRPRGYDAGGFLAPGLSTVYNGTGRPEPVLTTEQFAALRQSAAGGSRAGVTINGDVHTASVAEFLREAAARQRLDEALHPLFA